MDSMSFSLQSWSRHLAKVGGVVFGVAALAVPAFAQTRTDLVERGRYLVETIGVCGHCHTPQQLKDGLRLRRPRPRPVGGSKYHV
jgi:mono/diheme cytochrome c family protein